MNLQIHELASIFPRMPGEEFAALKLDIKANGLLEPIWLYDGKVLDGRHRYYACQETSVEPIFREYEGSDPRGFVVSLNLKRRHLDATQRVAKRTQLPVWLMFYHREDMPDAKDVQHGCPDKCPTGLFGGELFGLLMKENHRSKPFDPGRAGFVGHGNSGMVYWAESALARIASKEEVDAVALMEAA